MTAVVVGVDLSLRSTGIATAERCHLVKPAAGLTPVRRLRVIRAAIAEHCTGADLVVIEGLLPAAATPNSAYANERAGAWWLVVERLDALGHRIAAAAPQTRAKYATGRGNASKDEVLLAAAKRWPLREFRGNDEADALWLAALGHEALGDPIVQLPDSHRASAGKLTWITARPGSA